jgi:mitochondrial distribution and morphology protein 31
LGSIVCDYLTKWTGYQVSFRSAIVPRWREGTIRLGNVKIVCNKDTWTELCMESAAAMDKKLEPADVDVNFTYWNLDVDSIDITLSLWRWLDGRGIVQSANLQGVRGVCDRSHIRWADDWIPTRRKPEDGDFELESLYIIDALVSIKNPGFRPFNVSLFHCKIGTFRKQWMLFDFLCANSIMGSIDDCLFSVHKPQIKDLNQQKELKENWSRMVLCVD